MVIILNPNGTVNEELMLANGMNMETIKAVTDAATGKVLVSFNLSRFFNLLYSYMA